MLTLGLIIFSNLLWATSPEEEALILNQELEFLQASAQNVKTPETQTPQVTEKSPNRSAQNLEELYFGVMEEDRISTKAAARRRRMAP